MNRYVGFAILLLALVTTPAFSQIYNNGPINGNTDGWTINFGFVVSDTFTTDGTGVNGLQFGAWLFPGDVLLNAQVSITSSEFGGTTFFNGVVNFSQSSNCPTNTYGYSICTETSTSFSPIFPSAGTYWLDLQNAVVNDGDPIYWDENSGPSSASENSVGTIPSEAFTVFGECGAGRNQPDCGPPTVPEPSSMLLLGSGALTLFGSGMLRVLRGMRK